MNPNEPIKESEFVLRRLGESFTQFRHDMWASVSLWLLIPAVLAVIARIWYARHYRKVHGPAKPDATLFWLGWAAILTVGAFVLWTVYDFYGRDSAQLKASTSQLSSLGETNARYWYIFIGGVFALGAVYVALMYVRDARTVRWYWAVKLAILRITVYAILCFVFLLPARQTWERTEKQSRVVILIDISPSMTRVSDETARKGIKQKTRMDTLIELLTDDKVALVQNILKTNPISVYSFGTRLDESGQLLKRDSTPWGEVEWLALSQYDFRPFMLEGLSQEDKTALKQTTTPTEWSGPKPSPTIERVEAGNWAEWAAKWLEHHKGWAARKKQHDAQSGGKDPFPEKLVNGLSEAGNKTLAENLEKLEKRIDVARSIALGTNVPDSVATAINRESPNMVQGVIVFSDMRSNLGSESSYRELRNAAQQAKVPVFMVVVGEDRQNTSINITDVQADDVVPPDEGGKISVEADGVNLAGKTVPVELDVFLPGRDPKNDKASYTFKTKPGTGQPYTITFAPGEPPHGSVEFVLDPAKLAADTDPEARALVTESKDAAIKKPILKEGTWAVRARIPRDTDEAFPEEFHTRDRLGIQVIQKKIRILAVTSAPSREFQFLRTFLNREVLENRATLTILVQNEAGMSGNLTPNPTEQIIGKFPTKLDLASKEADPKEKQYNLNEYDVIIAFDMDWNGSDLNDPLISKQQAEDLKLWVERQGGGFLLVADRINTYQLARVEANSRLSPILEMLPVIPDDVIAVKIKAIPKTPRRLYMHPLPASDLLKIDDPQVVERKDGKEAPNDPVAGWERFFTDRDTYTESKDYKVELFPRRGFFSCYPVKEVKAGAHVLAEFADIDDRNEKFLRPYIVVNNPQAGFRTGYMGSGEIYRMYAYEREYYERYWAKMIKYMASKRNVKASRGRILTSKEVVSGNPIRVNAQLLNTSSKPYPPNAIDPKFKVLWTVNGEQKVEGPYPLIPTGVDGYYRGQANSDPKMFPPGDTEYTVVVDVPESTGETLKSNFRVLKSDLEMDVTKINLTAWLAMASDFDSMVQARVPDDTKADFTARLPKENGIPKLAFRLADKGLIKRIPDCFKTVSRSEDHRGPVDELWDERVALYNITTAKEKAEERVKQAQKDGTTPPPEDVELAQKPEEPTWLARQGFKTKVERNERAATPLKDFFKRGPRVFRTSAADTPPVDKDEKPIAARSPSHQISISWVILVVVFLLCWEWLTRKLLRLA